jgi:hypothetical protein
MMRAIRLLPLFAGAFTPAAAACRDMPPPPPRAALEACRQRPTQAACSFQLGKTTIEGTCLAPPNLNLACVPAGMIPGLPPGRPDMPPAGPPDAPPGK